MNKNAAYRELFTQTEARLIIPAAKNLILVTKRYDDAVALLELLEKTEYNFVEVDKPETRIALSCAERTVDALIAERAHMEREFRKLFERCIEKTFEFQNENLEFKLEVDAEAVCKVIREIEREAWRDFSFYSAEEKVDIIIDDIVNGLVFSDCCPPVFFNRYDDEDFDDDDDNCLMDAETVEEAIASVEEYLAELKEKAEELRKDEAKNKEK